MFRDAVTASLPERFPLTPGRPIGRHAPSQTDKHALPTGTSAKDSHVRPGVSELLLKRLATVRLNRVAPLVGIELLTGQI